LAGLLAVALAGLFGPAADAEEYGKALRGGK
jgi:hypothetical protein